jgi:hypothetical protein
LLNFNRISRVLWKVNSSSQGPYECHLQEPGSVHYRLGYPGGDDEPPHHYAILWTATDLQIAQVLGYPQPPPRDSNQFMQYRSCRFALVRLLESLLIQETGAHQHALIDEILLTKGYKVPDLIPQPLNRATGLEPAGALFESITGAAAGLASAKARESRWAREMGTGESRVGIKRYMEWKHGSTAAAKVSHQTFITNHR